jgi:biopolymer transport protein ExbD
MNLFSDRRQRTNGLGVTTLAPMVDIFTILVIAVLKASSPQPPVTLPEGSMALPLSNQENTSVEQLVVDIAKEGIYVDGFRVTAREYWEQSEEILISEVYSSLQQHAKKDVKIRVDKDVPWSLISKALHTAQQAGYEDIEMLVISSSSL